MVLTSSDIGVDPGTVERTLTKRFEIAMSWNAVLLIDEADVFMERRSSSDLSRNSLVAAFLRALEFYEGMLFLTTNRVGYFDDAFISRIHVQIYYPEFTPEERQQVWRTFRDKLDDERGEYIRLTLDAKEYIEGEAIKAVKWNGREIRNGRYSRLALPDSYENRAANQTNLNSNPNSRSPSRVRRQAGLRRAHHAHGRASESCGRPLQGLQKLPQDPTQGRRRQAR